MDIDADDIRTAANWHLAGAVKMTWDALFLGLGGFFVFVFLSDAMGEQPIINSLMSIGLMVSVLLLLVAMARIAYAGFLFFYANTRGGNR